MRTWRHADGADQVCGVGVCSAASARGGGDTRPTIHTVQGVLRATGGKVRIYPKSKLQFVCVFFYLANIYSHAKIYHRLFIPWLITTCIHDLSISDKKRVKNCFILLYECILR